MTLLSPLSSLLSPLSPLCRADWKTSCRGRHIKHLTNDQFGLTSLYFDISIWKICKYYNTAEYNHQYSQSLATKASTLPQNWFYHIKKCLGNVFNSDSILLKICPGLEMAYKYTNKFLLLIYLKILHGLRYRTGDWAKNVYWISGI